MKGHIVLNSFNDGFFLGEDPVDAVYLGEVKIWPSPIYEMGILYLPDED